MTDVIITHVRKDENGVIVCFKTSKGETFDKAALLIALSAFKHFTFYSQGPNQNGKALVTWVEDEPNGYFRSVPDSVLENNLDNLPLF